MRGNRATLVVVVVVVLAVVAGVVMVGFDLGPFASDETASRSPRDTSVSTSTTVTAEPAALPTGTLSLIDVPSDRNNKPCTATRCQGIQVDCPNIDPVSGVMSIQPPPAGTDIRGVFVLFSGGEGKAFWADEDAGGEGTPAGTRVLDEIEAAGIEIVQVRWVDGWIDSGAGDVAGMAAVACRPATAAEWVYDNEYTKLGLSPAVGQCGFCVGGSSGGAAQASYSLSHYGLSPIVNAMIISSGPPYAALAKGCSTDPQFAGYRYDPGNFHSIDPAYGTQRGEKGPCERGDPSFQAQFEADGADTGGTDYTYDSTRVVQLIGEADPTIAPIHSQDYFEKLQAAGSPMIEQQMFPGMVHSVTSTQQSLEAFIAAVVGTG